MDEETEQQNDVCGGKVEGADHYLHSRPAFFRALQREGSPALIVKPRPTVGRFSGSGVQLDHCNHTYWGGGGGGIRINHSSIHTPAIYSPGTGGGLPQKGPNINLPIEQARSRL